MNYLHSFIPHPIFFELGPLKIHWYGLIIVLGIMLAVAVSIKLAKYYSLSPDSIIDAAFYAVTFGIIGARIYAIFLELPFYLSNPLNIFMVWQGGLAIHGGIIGGLLALYFYAKKKKINLTLLLSILVPGLSLGQAIGRFGNYFNQELYGLPTGLPWGIPIDPINRIPEFFDFQYFHPTFLYESVGSFLIFLSLLLLHWLFLKNKIYSSTFKPLSSEIIIFSYLILYSLLRFFLEFLRIDRTQTLFNLRFPQIISLLIITLSILLFFQKFRKIKPLA